MTRRTRGGGWYCSKCGAIHNSLGFGAVYCGRCGALGLRGFDGAAPKRVPCPVDGCEQAVWDDGVNSMAEQHKWERHPEPVEAV